MSESDPKGGDLLGVRPIADAVSHAAKATVDGASAFLGRICLPAAGEIGLLLQDKVRAWRARNALKLITEAEAKYGKAFPDQKAYAHPRLLAAVVEHGSWSDERSLQEMWGGLLVSSCSPDGRDESNLIFISLLSQLTTLEARVLNYACEHVEKEIINEGLISPAKVLYVDVPTLKTIAGTDDIHRLDRELDHLRGLELMHTGFVPNTPQVDLTPHALALALYVRCQGYLGPPAAFFKLTRQVPPES